MVEIPTWALIAFTIFTVAMLVVVGYLLRQTLKTLERQRADADARIADLNRKVEELEKSTGSLDKRLADEVSRIDRRFLEEQLALVRKFVDREVWTRDYVTLSQRMDGLHKRIDRIDRTDRDPTRRSKRPDDPTDR